MKGEKRKKIQELLEQAVNDEDRAPELLQEVLKLIDDKDVDSKVRWFLQSGRAGEMLRRYGVSLRKRTAEEVKRETKVSQAKDLDEQAIRLSEEGKHYDATKAATSAMEIYRTLAREEPQKYTLEVAKALNNLAAFLDASGRPEKAMEATYESVTIMIPHFVDDREGLGKAMTEFANNYFYIAEKVHSGNEAYAAAAVCKVHKALWIALPNEFWIGYSQALSNLAVAHSTQTNKEESVKTHAAAIEVIAPKLNSDGLVEHGKAIGQVVANYLACCKDWGIAPDSRLLRQFYSAKKQLEREIEEAEELGG